MRAQKTPAELLVGLDAADDAAVYLVARDLAIVETLDFFPPIVDDAYASGAIGAANAMSDVYAMGGEVLFGLNIAAWPEDLSLEQLQRLFQGATDKFAEAGGVIAGGHTVIDREPNFGGLERNQAYFADGRRVGFDGVDEAARTLALDPQTSGGLLVAVPAAHADEWERARAANGVTATRIGEVVGGSGVTVVP